MLGETAVAQYKREGYCVCPALLTPAEVKTLLADLDAICAGSTLAAHDQTRMEMEPDQGPQGTSVRRVYEPCTHYPRFRALSESSAVLDAVEQLLGPDLLFHYSKINMKPARIGSVVEWHQDLAYFPLTNPGSVAVLFYLDDADTATGCLQVIPSAPGQPLKDHTRAGLFQGRITEPIDESPAVPLEGKAGTAIFLRCMTPHASKPNTSPRPRRTLILGYRAADAFPIFTGDMTVAGETHVRVVRGQRRNLARFEFSALPIPQYSHLTSSLYDLQQRSREDATRPTKPDAS
jgi:ectoine hydroxylase-related dioxygenase (phytanoyl-CoA dioxygenase family)